MAKPLGEKFRKGGRNAAFFPQLSGLQRALDSSIERHSMVESPLPEDKREAAEEKRRRRMERNRKLLEKQK